MRTFWTFSALILQRSEKRKQQQHNKMLQNCKSSTNTSSSTAVMRLFSSLDSAVAMPSRKWAIVTHEIPSVKTSSPWILRWNEWNVWAVDERRKWNREISNLLHFFFLSKHNRNSFSKSSHRRWRDLSTDLRLQTNYSPWKFDNVNNQWK